jgi:hypothetical protein
LTPALHDQLEGLADDLVLAEVHDVMTQPPGSVAQPYEDVVARINELDAARGVLVEVTAIAGEVLIRLAAARGEDTHKTWDWLMATEWH